MVEANNKGFSKVCYYELLDVDRKAEKKVIEKVSQGKRPSLYTNLKLYILL